MAEKTYKALKTEPNWTACTNVFCVHVVLLLVLRIGGTSNSTWAQLC